jgi:hypothetical protein
MLRALTKSPVVLPIPGPADLEHLEDNAGAAQLTLSLAQIRKASSTGSSLAESEGLPIPYAKGVNTSRSP